MRPQSGAHPKHVRCTRAAALRVARQRAKGCFGRAQARPSSSSAHETQRSSQDAPLSRAPRAWRTDHSGLAARTAASSLPTSSATLRAQVARHHEASVSPKQAGRADDRQPRAARHAARTEPATVRLAKPSAAGGATGAGRQRVMRAQRRSPGEGTQLTSPRALSSAAAAVTHASTRSASAGTAATIFACRRDTGAGAGVAFGFAARVLRPSCSHERRDP